MPIAWMVSSNGQQETMMFLLLKLWARNPDVKPKWIMSDKDRAQINSVEFVYPEAQPLLCWWHVLHAWQQHFVTSQHPELWALLKKWIRTTEQDAFDRQWDAIKQIAPASIIQYLETEWWEDRNLWSVISRKGRSILELGDTNMLVEV
jgi:hypothetical protein